MHTYWMCGGTCVCVYGTRRLVVDMICDLQMQRFE